MRHRNQESVMTIDEVETLAKNATNKAVEEVKMEQAYPKEKHHIPSDEELLDSMFAIAGLDRPMFKENHKDVNCEKEQGLLTEQEINEIRNEATNYIISKMQNTPED